MVCSTIVFSDHAIGQMFKRDILVDDVKQVIDIGEVIKEYPNDKPYPSYLMLYHVNHRPLHLVVAKDDLDKCIVITVYEPTKEIWATNFKTKIK
jgi:hypothetical protein